MTPEQIERLVGTYGNARSRFARACQDAGFRNTEEADTAEQNVMATYRALMDAVYTMAKGAPCEKHSAAD